MRISDWSSDVCSSDLSRQARICTGVSPAQSPLSVRLSKRHVFEERLQRGAGGDGPALGIVLSPVHLARSLLTNQRSGRRRSRRQQPSSIRRPQALPKPLGSTSTPGRSSLPTACSPPAVIWSWATSTGRIAFGSEIGRASCREKGGQ